MIHSYQSNPIVTVAVAFEKSNLANIREMPHKDQYGNLIST